MNWKRRWVRHLGLWLFFGLLVGVMSLPAPLTLSTKLIGNNVDNWIFYWNDWWLKTALSEHHALFFTPYAFFPQGASLVAHSNSFLSSALAWPLSLWVGPVAASNLVWLFGLWAGAVGMFWLIYELTRSPAGALVAGFVFAFAPYHLTQALSHAHLGSIHWWPWYALCLHRALHRGRKRDAIAAGFFAALALWNGLQLAVMLALWTMLYLISTLVIEWRNFFHHFLRRLGVALIVGIIALALCAPLLIAIAGAWESGWTEGFDESLSHQSDLLSYFIPPTYHPLWGDVVQPVYEHFIANRAYMPYLGYISIILSIVALFAFFRARRASEGHSSRPVWVGFWAIGLALWTLLAAGSALRVNGTLYETLRLPYAWIGHLFPISTLRSPDRMNLLGVFSLAALAGYGAAWLARRRVWLLLPIGLLLLTEYLCMPLPRWDLLPDSPFYAQMAQEPPTYAVLDYPLGYDQAKLWLYYQTLHGKPTVEGHISRYTPELYTLITSNSITRALYQVSREDRPRLLSGDAFASQSVPLRDLGPALRELRDLGVRYVLAHKPYMDAESVMHLRRVLPFAPAYEDETLAVYDLADPLAVTYDVFPARLSDSLALAHFDVTQGANGTWQLQVLAQTLRDGEAPFPCVLALTRDERTWITQTLTLFGDPSALPYQAGDLDALEATIPAAALPFGEFGWLLTCGDSSYRPVERLVVDASGSLYTRSAAVFPDSAASTDGVTFADIITLAGYRWRTEGAELRLDLWWDAKQAPGVDYKLFVHLLDSGGAVAQYDAMPCEWTCPTSGWQAGQRIHDEAELRLWDLPAGKYQIALGWYHPDAGERLPATFADDRTFAGDPAAGYVILPDTLVIQRR
ncbi:MAG: hypothetical protein JXA21_27445 [Anaerolineae bacterium]|nr:hypothetical protein [Anaerolineae bacterium]